MRDGQLDVAVRDGFWYSRTFLLRMDAAQLLKWILPPALWHRVRTLKLRCDDALGPAFRQIYRGHSHHCPICDSHIRRFRARRTCPVCRSRDRHRLAYMIIQRETDLLTRPDATLLHLAPEPSLVQQLRRTLGTRHVSADLHNPEVRIRLDVQHMPLADASYDAIYCSHVLEHVEDDLRALGEFYRVLRPGGVALVQVPIIRDLTFRDPAITTRKGRLDAYGQVDHEIAYGRDFPDRVRGCGFDVRTLAAASYLAEEERRRADIAPDECLFLCRRPHDASMRLVM
jgi:hypothetical protein